MDRMTDACEVIGFIDREVAGDLEVPVSAALFFFTQIVIDL